MKLAYKMEYLNPINEKTSVSLIPYSAEYQEQYKKIYNQCYHEMREALDIKPYDFIQDNTFFESGMENVFLLIDTNLDEDSEKNEIIGSVALKEEEIDDLIVNPKFQGQGYGKQILLWALENYKAKNIVLHVAGWNEKAINLYKKTGFEITETIEIK